METDLELIAAISGIVLMGILILFSLRGNKYLSKEQKTKTQKEFLKPLN
jgi:hypothetical protein